MDLYKILSLLLTVTALIAYINNRTLKLPTTIAVMGGALILSLGLIVVGQFGLESWEIQIAQYLAKLDFKSFLLQGLLSFLLFAGALTVDLNALKRRKWEITTLASFSTIASTFIIGYLTYGIFNGMGIPIHLLPSLLFGALISPTDPIAVLAIFKDVGASKNLHVTVSGESLFNDGVAIVLFITLYQLAYTQQVATFSGVIILFLQEAVGGLFYGAVLGYIGSKCILKTDNTKVQLLITIAITTGGYTLASPLGVSGPLAMVAAGLMIGDKIRTQSSPSKTQHALDDFWELVDEILNALLFSLMGLEIILIDFHYTQWFLIFAMVPLVLLVRWVTVGIPMLFFKRYNTYDNLFVTILTWGGLRGGLAVALALSLPADPHRNLFLTMTYVVVAFAVIVQGLTVKPLVKRSQLASKNAVKKA